jgi:acetone carboxylase alpha subunit
MKYIASSPAIRDFEEFVIGLYTPEGDAIALSTGIMVHVHTLSEFIKFMIRNGYEDDPQIRPETSSRTTRRGPAACIRRT